MKIMKTLGALILLAIFSTTTTANAQPKESAAQRDARLAWWREARFGMFIHPVL
jgi:alpha-L-fucosidase